MPAKRPHIVCRSREASRPATWVVTRTHPLGRRTLPINTRRKTSIERRGRGRRASAFRSCQSRIGREHRGGGGGTPVRRHDEPRAGNYGFATSASERRCATKVAAVLPVSWTCRTIWFAIGAFVLSITDAA